MSNIHTDHNYTKQTQDYGLTLDHTYDICNISPTNVSVQLDHNYSEHLNSNINKERKTKKSDIVQLDHNYSEHLNSNINKERKTQKSDIVQLDHNYSEHLNSNINKETKTKKREIVQFDHNQKQSSTIKRPCRTDSEIYQTYVSQFNAHRFSREQLDTVQLQDHNYSKPGDTYAHLHHETENRQNQLQNDTMNNNINSPNISNYISNTLNTKKKSGKNVTKTGMLSNDNEINIFDPEPENNSDSSEHNRSSLKEVNISECTINQSQHSLTTLDVPGDGNCFFHCISLSLHGDISFHKHYRKLICEFVFHHWEEMEETVLLHHDLQTSTSKTMEQHYWETMVVGRGWATACEIQVAVSLLQRNIFTWLKGTKYNEHTLSHENCFNIQKYTCGNSDNETINVLLENSHFQLIVNVTSASENDHNKHNEPTHSSPAIKTHRPKKRQKETETQQFKNCKPKTLKQLRYSNYMSQCLIQECRKMGIAHKPLSEVDNLKTWKNNLRKKIKKKKQSLQVHLTSEEIPLPHPVSNNNEQFNTAMDSIRAFELKQMSYKFNICKICNERRLELKLSPKDKNICHRCYTDKCPVKMFSDENNMNPGPIPAQLQNLTIIEEQLISRLAPCINVHLLKHGGLAANGHCVAFPQAIDQPYKIFPKLPEEIHLIRVRKLGKNDTSKEFNVRRGTVQSALFWLKENNPAYNDITISQDRLNKLPINGPYPLIQTVEFNPIAEKSRCNDVGPAPNQILINSETENQTENETISGVLLPEPNIDIRKKVESIVQEVMGPDQTVTKNKKGVVSIPWPTRDTHPVPEFTQQYFFTLAFPCLFPHGTGDFKINRPRTCSSMSDWADHLLWYKDGRFARHRFFKFIVHNIIIRKRVLEQSTFVIRQQLGDENMTVSDLKDKIQEGDKSIAEKILYFGASLRGTSQYWAQKSRELRSLIQFQINEGKGLPSFFTTGSCAEYYFKPLRRLLSLYICDTTGKVPDLDNRSTLFAALQNNTHVVAHYFDLRTQSYFKQVMGPVFGVDTYWYRQEFAKSRGMIHWHGLCWRSDRQPHNLLYEAVQNNLSNDESADELAKWAKSVFGMTACHPAGKSPDGNPRKDLWPPPEGTGLPPSEDKNPLVKLLMDVCQSQDSLLEDHLLLTNRINLHRCSDYCLRPPRHSSTNSSKTQLKSCRMDFGDTVNPGKSLRTAPALVRDKNGSLRLEMERDHPMLVQHSQYHTQGWRANGDISIILSQSDPSNPSVNEIIATEKYVSGYACKGNEPTGATAALFNDIVHSADESTGVTPKSLCIKLLMGTVKRDISAVEAAFEICSLPLYRSSHQFQYVSMSGSRVLERTGTTVTKQTPLDKYLARKEGDKRSWYQFICNGGRVPVISGTSVRATWPLNNEYSRTVLLLHWPNWRKISDIKGEEVSWVNKMEDFLKSDDCPGFVKADVERARRQIDLDEYEKNSDNESTGQLSESEDNEQPDWISLIQPTAVFDRVEMEDFPYDDGGPDYDWSSNCQGYNLQNCTNWLQNINETLEISEGKLNLPNVKVESLNKEQKFAFNLVLDTLLKYKHGVKFDPLRLVVAGTAGSGKSFLINSLVKAIRLLFHSNKSVQVICPTGNSANLISGVTIHSFLKIPPRNLANKEMSSPDGSIGEALQKNCDGLVALLVDERSLVGCTTLGWMEFMTSCALGNKSHNCSLWGGLPVVVFLGDDAQLPPVCDLPVYTSSSNCKTQSAIHGAMVWANFNSAVILKTIIRQDNNQRQLKDTLLAMREYKTSKDQANWLQKFQWNALKTEYGPELLGRMQQDGLFVFPTHADEWNQNRKKILELNKFHPIAKINAETHGIHSKSISSDKANGLLRTLYLCKGAKVLLTVNLNVKYGLFNGSFGKVVEIIYKPGTSPLDSLPLVVIVDFPRYSGPPFLETKPTFVPVVPVERKVDCRCFSCKRKQIPLRLGWGTTIHRCQGMTIGDKQPNRYIVIHPGTTSFESRNPGALFVALSRAKSAGGNGSDPDFAFHPDVLVNQDRLCHVVDTPTTKARKKEMTRISQLAEKTKLTFKCLDNEDSFKRNIQLLNSLSMSEE